MVPALVTVPAMPLIFANDDVPVIVAPSRLLTVPPVPPSITMALPPLMLPELMTVPPAVKITPVPNSGGPMVPRLVKVQACVEAQIAGDALRAGRRRCRAIEIEGRIVDRHARFDLRGRADEGIEHDAVVGVGGDVDVGGARRRARAHHRKHGDGRARQ